MGGIGRSTDTDTTAVPNSSGFKRSLFAPLHHTCQTYYGNAYYKESSALDYLNKSTASPCGFMLQGHRNKDEEFRHSAGMDIAVGALDIAGRLGQICYSRQIYRAWYTTNSSPGRQCASEMMSRIDSIRRKLKGAPRTWIPTLALAMACIHRSPTWPRARYVHLYCSAPPKYYFGNLILV